jgi:4-amino-4-deoxy-L-arabinose transferase-like glycosyltransferase
LTTAALLVIILLGAWLRGYELGASSVGNAYYAATVKSMLTSRHAFFFAAYEPGGSVSVDKPPLGFWVQAASAYLWGVNGFALALPQALAGVLAIPLLYTLVRRPFGAGAGLLAALTLATMPVTVATERNNTVDGLLLFVLLLAAWAFMRATRSGRLGHLLLGAGLVGVGFNIKMLQAFMPLPAFYLLYWLGAPRSWGRRTVHLAVATVLLVVVCLAWAVAVDMTPADARPYVGGSRTNSVLELAIGHNGLKRLGLDRLVGAKVSGGPSPVGPPSMPLGDGLPGQGPPPPSSQLPQLPPGQGPGGPAQEVGIPGVMRLFSAPLATQASWAGPLVLLGLPLTLLVVGWRWPLGERPLALVLWVGWLLPEVVYFSFTSGLFHVYYLLMLGPPLAALVGITGWALARTLGRMRRWRGWSVAAVLVAVTLAFQLRALHGYPAYQALVLAGAIPLLGLGLFLTWRRGSSDVSRVLALGSMLLATLVAPLAWSAATTLNPRPDVTLPHAGPEPGDPRRSGDIATLSPSQRAILDHTLDHTPPGGYLLAALSAHETSAYILATGRPVLTFGGFNGSDIVVNAEGLARMVADGALRFVLGQNLDRARPEIFAWLQERCTLVDGAWHNETGPGGERMALYDCGGGR